MQLSLELSGGNVWLLDQSFGHPGSNRSASCPHAGLTWMRKGVALCWERAGKEIPLGYGLFCHADALSCYRGVGAFRCEVVSGEGVRLSLNSFPLTVRK